MVGKQSKRRMNLNSKPSAVIERIAVFVINNRIMNPMIRLSVFRCLLTIILYTKRKKKCFVKFD